LVYSKKNVAWFTKRVRTR